MLNNVPDLKEENAFLFNTGIQCAVFTRMALYTKHIPVTHCYMYILRIETHF